MVPDKICPELGLVGMPEPPWQRQLSWTENQLPRSRRRNAVLGFSGLQQTLWWDYNEHSYGGSA